jgi:hypothetical protein
MGTWKDADQSVVQAIVVGDGLEVGFRFGGLIPQLRLTRAGKGTTFCRIP